MLVTLITSQEGWLNTSWPSLLMRMERLCVREETQTFFINQKPLIHTLMTHICPHKDYLIKVWGYMEYIHISNANGYLSSALKTSKKGRVWAHRGSVVVCDLHWLQKSHPPHLRQSEKHKLHLTCCMETCQMNEGLLLDMWCFVWSSVAC